MTLGVAVLRWHEMQTYAWLKTLRHLDRYRWNVWVDWPYGKLNGELIFSEVHNGEPWTGYSRQGTSVMNQTNKAGIRANVASNTRWQCIVCWHWSWSMAGYHSQCWIELIHLQRRNCSDLSWFSISITPTTLANWLLEGAYKQCYALLHLVQSHRAMRAQWTNKNRDDKHSQIAFE